MCEHIMTHGGQTTTLAVASLPFFKKGLIFILPVCRQHVGMYMSAQRLRVPAITDNCDLPGMDAGSWAWDF